MKSTIYTFLLLSAFPAAVWAQSELRRAPGNGVVQELPLGTTGIPCAGSPLFSEDMESGLGNWTVLDLDGLTPHPNTGLVPGWQVRTDYYDTTNTVAVSCSFYDPIGTSNDWLVSGPVTLGSNPCLSWKAYSKDQYYKEAYEVRISTGGADTASFNANAALATVNAESEVPGTRSVSLMAYANQTVRIAFHHTSVDKFVLALDDISVTNVNTLDIGVYSFEAPVSTPGDTISFEMEVANYGSDTVRSFEVFYQIEAGTIRSMTIDSIAVGPNSIHSFTHSVDFISDTLDLFYDFCAWTTLPNGLTDQEISNDSLCNRFSVGSPVGVPAPSELVFGMTVFPNPVLDHVKVEFPGYAKAKRVEMRLYDLQGKMLAAKTVQSQLVMEWDALALPAGMYVLAVDVDGVRAKRAKIIVE